MASRWVDGLEVGGQFKAVCVHAALHCIVTFISALLRFDLEYSMVAIGVVSLAHVRKRGKPFDSNSYLLLVLFLSLHVGQVKVRRRLLRTNAFFVCVDECWYLVRV